MNSHIVEVELYKTEQVPFTTEFNSIKNLLKYCGQQKR